MNKEDIFRKILDTSAQVCNVESEEIIEGVRTLDVVSARSICVFWAKAVGLSNNSILKIIKRTNDNSINSILANVELFWTERPIYHMLLREVGKILHEFSLEIDENFDIDKPYKRLATITGMYMPTKSIKEMK